MLFHSDFLPSSFRIYALILKVCQVSLRSHTLLIMSYGTYAHHSPLSQLCRTMETYTQLMWSWLNVPKRCSYMMATCMGVISAFASILELRLWSCRGHRLRNKARKRFTVGPIEVRDAQLRPIVTSSSSQTNIIIEFLCRQILAFNGNPLCHHRQFIYGLSHGGFNYIGRSAG